MFAITLLNGNLGPDGEQLGEVRIEGFCERFSFYPHPPDGSFPRLWHIELRGLVRGASSAVLRYGPQRAWVLYREDAAVYVQDQLLIPGWDGSLSEEGTVLSVPPHRTISDTGEPISEWETTVQSIETFLDVFAV